MIVDDNTLIGIVKDGKLVDVVEASEASEEIVMELVAEKILELPTSGHFGKVNQKEADLISEPKD